MNNYRLQAMMGRRSRTLSAQGGDTGASPMGAAAPAAAPGGAAASISAGGLDISGRLSAALLMGSVLFLGGVYVATRRIQL
jgi:hypothetical protein